MAGNWHEHGTFTIGRHVADVAGLIETLGVGAVHLLGHSRGGHVAFRVAERHPALLARWCWRNRGNPWTEPRQCGRFHPRRA
ncbi:alpha/beta fold hydrolase [Falsiroseomonas sp. E2-1-a4]|uniref:alpha/beta fold hydrolase n=1 Tax=Falsiroseomonas sp. E2-1-a4 TaxID=3239299 RepID=UPI003F328694